MAQFVVKEYGNAPAVPTGVLMEVLRQELQVRRGSGGGAAGAVMHSTIWSSHCHACEALHRAMHAC